MDPASVKAETFFTSTNWFLPASGKPIMLPAPLKASVRGLYRDWLLMTLARMTPAGKDRIFFLEQADIVKDEEVAMRKLRKGWSQYGVTDPWFVVHPEKEPWLPRHLH